MARVREGRGRHLQTVKPGGEGKRKREAKEAGRAEVAAGVIVEILRRLSV